MPIVAGCGVQESYAHGAADIRTEYVINKPMMAPVPPQDDPPEDENALWQTVMRDVKPLKKPLKTRAAAKPPPKKPAQKPSFSAAKPLPANLTKTPEKPISDKHHAGLDKRTDERLRRGQMPIEARLDLHGMHQGPAQEALLAFIQTATAQGKRCVLVITGKGQRAKTTAPGDEDGRKPGVLKQSLPQWLRDPRIGSMILQVYPAQPRDGGSGAFYVLLRRQR
jgi:DNA-nicking Smr family endonuclease